MEHGRARSHLIATVSAVAALLVVGFVYAEFVPSGHQLLGGTGSLLGWAVPLVLLFMVVAVTWFVIVRDSRGTPEDTARYVSCGSCGHDIQNEWRMCPFCGAEQRSLDAADGMARQS